MEALLALQDLDSAMEQCEHRRSRLPELAQRAAAREALAAAQQRRADAVAVTEEATAKIETLEHAEEARQKKRARLEAQLKTVISVRESEALMSEIRMLSDERSESDEQELLLMDEVEAAEKVIAEIDADLPGLTEAHEAARSALSAAQAAIDEERARLEADREQTATALDAALLSRYESLRKSFGGVAIARVHAGRCSACHLDQSRTALDALKSLPPGEAGECEQCGRLLVL